MNINRMKALLRSAMFSYVINIFLLSFVSAIPSGRVDVVFPFAETLRSGVKTVHFRALGQDIRLNLVPAGEVIADDFKILNGLVESERSVDVGKLKSIIYRDSQRGAALIIKEDGPITIKGIVNDRLRIEPYDDRRMSNDGRIAHRVVEVVYDKRSLISDKDFILRSGKRKKGNLTLVHSRDDNCIVIEYLFVTESNLTERFIDESDLTEYISTTAIGAQNMLDTLNLGLKIRIIGISRFTKADEPEFIEKSHVPKNPEFLNIDILFDSMKKYYCEQNNDLINRADIIFLVSRRGFVLVTGDGTVGYGVLGVSNLGSTCDKCAKCGISLDDTNYNERCDTVAHETGHMIGIPHDGDDGQYLKGSPGSVDCPQGLGYIMGEDYGENQYKFSSCSKRNAEYFLKMDEASCIFESCSN